MQQPLSPIYSRLGYFALIILWLNPGFGYAKTIMRQDYGAQIAHAMDLAKRGDDNGASKVYEALIKQDPKRPQAYNNLAAIKARAGELKQARTLLEKALNNNPVYATVYANLSAIYVEMARDSYGKALHLATPSRAVVLRELPSSLTPRTPTQVASASLSHQVPTSEARDKHPVAQKKLPTVKPVNHTTPVPAAAKLIPTPRPQTASSPTQLASTGLSHQVSTSEAQDKHTPAQKKLATVKPASHATPIPIAAKPRPTPVPSPQVSDTNQASSSKLAAQTRLLPNGSSSAATATPSPKATPKLASEQTFPQLAQTAQTGADNQRKPGASKVPAKNVKQEVITTLQGWAAAWSGQAVGLYLSFYADNYAPRGVSHQQWQALRQTRLKTPKWIKVSLSDFQVGPVKDGEVRVRLMQQYRANDYHDMTHKEFKLRQTPDGWRIIKEITLAEKRH